MPQVPPGSPSETVLGSDATFKGELSYDGALRIEGRFEGKIASKGRLTVGKGAHVAGDITVSHAAVEGAFKGNIFASERVELSGTAQLNGDIRAPRLVVGEGATLVGNCVISPDALKSVPPSRGEEVRGASEREQILSGLGEGSSRSAVPAKR